MSDKTSGVKHHLILLALYYITLATIFLASFFPDLRLWGINWWAYQPLIAKLGYLLVALAAGPILLRRFKKEKTSVRSQWGHSFKSGVYASRTILLLIAYSLSFVIFMGTTHFLGDGYQLLSRLADNAATLKIWDKGAAILYSTVYTLLGEGGEAGALTAYRIVSVVSGMVMLAAIIILSRPLFKYNLSRFLFAFGLATGGYMLMFFGYVENYPLLIVSLMIYGLLGMLVVRGIVSRWWLLPPFAVAVSLHIFGITLLPSLVYIFARHTGWGRRLENLSGKTAVLAAVPLVVIGGVIYYFVYTHSYFFTFALMPLFPDRFTVDNDWLFSFKHIVDTVNLLIMMVPGLAVTAAVWWLSSRDSTAERRSEYIFLWILFLSTLLVIYIFNPGIGMPRNWDLFAISGVPLAILCFYYLLNRPQPISLFATALVIMLGLMVLFPRVMAQVSSATAIAHFENYMDMDPVRSRNARRLLIDYYRTSGQTSLAEREQAKAWEDYPESRLNRQGKDLMYNGNYAEACSYFQEAMEINPIYHDAYANLGGCLLALGKHDSALVLCRIADGLNPYNAATLNNIGTACLRIDNYEEARSYFRKALNVDSLKTNSLIGLATAELKLGDFDQSLDCLARLFADRQLPFDVFRQAGDAFVEAEAFEQARQAYRFALSRGLDSTYIRQQMTKYPQLAQ